MLKYQIKCKSLNPTLLVFLGVAGKGRKKKRYENCNLLHTIGTQ